MTRDLWLITHRAGLWDTVSGLAWSTLAILPNRHIDRLSSRVGAVGEMLGRYEDLVLAVAPAALEYRPDMPEAALRAWAASLVGALPK